MTILELVGVTWPGGPAQGVSLSLEEGCSLQLEVPAAQGLGRRILGGAEGGGRVSWRGDDLEALPPWRRARLGLFLVSGSLPALPGLSLPTLIRSGLAQRRPSAAGAAAVRALIVERGRELGLAPEDLARPWETAASAETAWRRALLIADCLRPELPIYCPPDAAAAKALAGRKGSQLLLLEGSSRG